MRRLLLIACLAGCSKPPAAGPTVDMNALCMSADEQVRSWDKLLAGSDVSCATLAREGRLAIGTALGMDLALDAVPGAGSAAKDFVVGFARETNAWGMQSDICLDLHDPTVAANNLRTTLEEARAKLADTQSYVDAHCNAGSASK
jgi:hypothetical protein